jgi:hypothetical protein
VNPKGYEGVDNPLREFLPDHLEEESSEKVPNGQNP